eukprot:scaffold1169_cov245-Pinguiococcus_pyrenoidosus.AAC.7
MAEGSTPASLARFGTFLASCKLPTATLERRRKGLDAQLEALAPHLVQHGPGAGDVPLASQTSQQIAVGSAFCFSSSPLSRRGWQWWSQLGLLPRHRPLAA